MTDISDYSAFADVDFGGFFAKGGSLGAGKWGIAGERGPEIIKGPAQVVPAARAGGDSTTIVVQGDVGPKTLKAMRLALAQHQAQMAYQQRYA